MEEDKKDPKGRKIVSLSVNVTWFYAILLAGVAFLLFFNHRNTRPEKIEWAEVQEMASQGDVAEIVFVRNDFKANSRNRCGF